MPAAGAKASQVAVPRTWISLAPPVCCSGNVMRSALSYSGLTSFTARAFSGQPGSVSVNNGGSPPANCWSGSLASWSMLQNYLGTSP